MEKKYCDKCGKEITNNLGLHGMRFSFWGTLYTGHISKDFCSVKCLKEFVNKLKGK